MKNRYGNEYCFEQVDNNTFVIKGELGHWRFGGNEGEESVDYANLGFVDPSGGPFIARGYKIEGRSVVRIYTNDTDIYFEVE